jgi:cytochrome c peroxidase
MAVPMFNEHPRARTADVKRRPERFTAGDDVARFRRFPDEQPPVTLGTIVKAIAAFERTLVSGDSPLIVTSTETIDRRFRLELRGMKLFFRTLRCAGATARSICLAVTPEGDKRWSCSSTTPLRR